MKYKPIYSVDYIVIHCAATPAHMDIGVEEIRQWHRERGYFDIGYHFVYRRDGTEEFGRPTNMPGAHARGFNHRSLGLCLVGGVGEDGKAENNFTDEQFFSLKHRIHLLRVDHPDAVILGHRDLPNVSKACPSFDAMAWWEEEFGNFQTHMTD